MLKQLFTAVAFTGFLGGAPVAAQKAQPVPPGPVDVSNAYGWIDRADALWAALGDAPPDFTLRFDGVVPWGWQTKDGYQIFVEDLGAGGIRSYYFAPGEETPFLLVEPGASFGFVGAQLRMIYSADGGALRRVEWGNKPERAQRAFTRATRLKQAFAQQSAGRVDVGNWEMSSGSIHLFMRQWDAGRSFYPGWQAQRDSAEAAARRAMLVREAARRQAASEQFMRWRNAGYTGPAPANLDPPKFPVRPPRGYPERPDIK